MEMECNDGDGSTVGGSHAVEMNGTSQGISVVHVTLPDGQPIQVQSVIQQASVIQTAPSMAPTMVQVLSPHEDDVGEDPDGKKRREILARRPSYRKILNDLHVTSDSSGMTRIDEEGNSQDSQDSSENSPNTQANSIQYQGATVIPAQTIHIAAAHGDGNGVQTLTMSNAAHQSAPQGATIVQYAQGPDGQFFIPASNVAAYQITTPTSLPQGVVMASSNIGSPQQLTEEVSRKRELRLLKNRQAASECRRKKKEYIKCLESRVAVLENQNKALVQELRTLKELYCNQKDTEPSSFQ